MKKIFSSVIVLAAVAMVGCAGNPNKKAAEVEVVAAEAQCCEKCDSTECADCTQECAKAEGECCNK